MPRGFSDIESGGDLSEKLHAVVWDLRDDLKLARESGFLTPERQLSGRKIAAMFGESKGVKLSDSDIRAMVNFLRQKEEPIISTNKGYFYAMTWEEAEFWMKSLHDRLVATERAYNGVMRSFGKAEDQMKLFS
jgi:hypothetical protein